MKTYTEFHGEIDISNIGKRLRLISKSEVCFKILTGYGASSYQSKSKQSALNSLSKMKKEGIISGYLPGEIAYQVLGETSIYYDTLLRYINIIKNDPDYGNDGVIFVFVK